MRTPSNPFGLALVALAVGVLFLVLLVEGCTTTPASPKASGTAVTSSAIKPYGSLAIAQGTQATSMSLDPYIVSGPSFFVLGTGVLDSLGYYDAKNQLQPGIAERWEIAPDGRTWTFHIRKGVKFHNGDDLTGADVEFSIKRALSPDNTASDAPGFRAAVASAEMKDDYTVVLRLKDPRFEFPRGFETRMTAVLPKGYVEKNGMDYFLKHPVGSGPWRVVSYEPQTRVELEAMESHWRAVPKFKSITLLPVAEEATKVAMLKTGELDLAVVAADSVPALKSAGLGIDHWSSGAELIAPLFFDGEHLDKDAMGDIRVRKALQLGLNNKEIIDKLLGGFGGPVVMWGVDPDGYYFDPNILKVDPYDPEQAKKLLAEAGYPSGFKTKIWDRSGSGGGLIGTISLAISGYWQKIGVSSNVEPVENAAFVSKFLPKVQPELWNSVSPIMAGTGPRQFEGMVNHHSTKGPFRVGLKTPRLDELIDKVPTITDPVEKKKLALEAAVLAHEKYAVLGIAVPHVIVGRSSKVADLAHLQYSQIQGLTYETITHAK